MALPTTISGISTAAACAGPFKTSSTPTTTTSSTGATYSFGFLTGAQKAGQTFTVPAGGGLLTQCVFNLGKNNSPTDNITVDVYAVDGSGLPTGASLGTSSALAGSSLTGTGTDKTFSFSPAISLSGGVKYAAVLSRSGSVENTNNYFATGASTDVYGSGGSLSFDGSWTGTTADLRLVFSCGEAYYFFGRSSADADDMVAMKATDPTSSFSSVATTGTNNNPVQSISAFQVGDIVHIAYILFNSGLASLCYVKYIQFDMSADTFSSAEDVQASFDPRTSANATVAAASLVVRSNGTVVAFYNGARVASMGNSYARVVYKRRVSGTWDSSATAVDAGGASDWQNPWATLGTNASGRVHFYWDGGGSRMRALNSSDALQTETSASIPPLAGTHTSRFFNSDRLLDVGRGLSSGVIQSNRAQDADVPTWSSASAADVNCDYPMRLFDDGTDIWLLFRNSSDSDLDVSVSTNNGQTFSTPVEAFAGTVAQAQSNLSRDGNIYQRGNDIVIPYVVNDNGTLKYNEYVVRSVGGGTHQGTSVLASSTTLALNANMRLAASTVLAASSTVAARAAQIWVTNTATLAGSSTLSLNALRFMFGTAVLPASSSLLLDAVFLPKLGEGLLAGDSTLSAQASLALTAQAVLAASSTLTVAGTLALAGVTVLAASSTLTAVASRTISDAPTLAGSGELISLGRLSLRATTVLAGSTALTAVTSLTIPATTTLAGSSTLTADTLQALAGRTVLAGTSSLTSLAILALAGTVTLPASSTLTVTTSLALPGRATFAGDSAVLLDALRFIFGTAVLVSDSSLIADAVVTAGFIVWQATAVLESSSTLRAQGQLALVGTAILEGSGTVSAFTSLALRAAAVLPASGELVATGVLTLPTVATLTASSELIAASLLYRVAATTLAGNATLSAATTSVLAVTAVLAASGTLTTSASLSYRGAATLPADSTLTAASLHFMALSAVLPGNSTLTALGVLSLPSNAILAGSATLTALALLNLPANALLAASSDLIATGAVFKPSSALLEGTSSLTAEAMRFMFGLGAFAGQGAFAVDTNLHIASVLRQIHFRFRTDGDAVDAAPTWGELEDVS